MSSFVHQHLAEKMYNGFFRGIMYINFSVPFLIIPSTRTITGITVDLIYFQIIFVGFCINPTS